MTSQLDIMTNDISLNKHSGDIVFLSCILSEANGTDIDRILSAVKELFKPNGFLAIADRFESGLVNRISRGLAETNCLDIVEHGRQIDCRNTLGVRIDNQDCLLDLGMIVNP